MNAPKVVIIGAGFGGLRAARQLARSNVQITLVDRHSYHMFTPLLYQVATASLSTSEVAVPIRTLFRGRKNVQCLMAEVETIDFDAQQVVLRNQRRLDYDYLVIAAGASTHYFGKREEWAPHVETLDDLASAERLRDRLILAFEAAELEADPVRRQNMLTFCILGGGPSGVELAGAIAELGRSVLARDYSRVHPNDVRVLLFEAQDRLLTAFDHELSRKAKEQLESLGVEVKLGVKVESVGAHTIKTTEGQVHCALICWGSGVGAASLASAIDSEKIKGRLVVRPDLSLPGHTRVFAIGDIAHFPTASGAALPGLAPVALQQGGHVAKTILNDYYGEAREPFRYNDRGIMATIGRKRAVAQTGKLRLSGVVAWLSWLALHVWYLIGFRTKLLVSMEWAWAYVSNSRGARFVEAKRDPAAEFDVGRIDERHAELPGLQLQSAEVPSAEERGSSINIKVPPPLPPRRSSNPAPAIPPAPPSRYVPLVRTRH